MSAGSVTLTDISSADWSLTLDVTAQPPTAGAGIGKVVQGIDDVNQTIGIILSTPPGSDPLRPTFACDLWSLIDKPIDTTRPLIVREIVESLLNWEPRVSVLSVTVDLMPGTLSQLSIIIVWQLKIAVAGIGPQRLALTVPRNLV